MDTQITSLQAKIAPLREQLAEHTLYKKINAMSDIRLFMQSHVYAVWDFMSLLKALQRNLTCVNVPWIPVGSAETRFLINEIVVGEESDVDENGVRMSHYELYLKAMQQAGADTQPIERLVAAIAQGQPIMEAIEAHIPTPAARNFMRLTFETALNADAATQAAVFTFGREDLIPDMFMAIVKDLDSEFPEQISTFKYYLERHIEVDGDHHSHLALAMTQELCGNDPQKWAIAEKATIKGLEVRIALWNEIEAQITANQLELV